MQNNHQDRLSALTRKANQDRQHSGRYSKFIRFMRIALPLTALCIVAVLLSWDFLKEDTITPARPSPDTTTAQVGKNELLNPRFDSVDDKNQPYTITAEKALQGTKDEMVLLEKPVADIVLNSGKWLAIQSKQGAFRQQSQRLLLKNDVQIFHDDGYTITTQTLDVDLDKGTAQTDVTISGHGPLGTLDASGMKADTENGTLIFTGPAKIVLYEASGPSGAEVFKP